MVRDNVDTLIDDFGDKFDLCVFTTYEGHPDPYQIDIYSYRGIPVTRVSVPHTPDMDWRWQDDQVGRIFSEYLRRERLDLVHFHCIQRLTNSVVEATRAAGIRYLITVHDGWWISDHQFLVDETGNLQVPKGGGPLRSLSKDQDTTQSLRRLAELRRSLDGADAVLAVSHSFAQLYRDAGIGRLLSVPNGVSPINTEKRAASTCGRVRLGHIGGMTKHKGLHLVRRALMAGTFRNLELIVVDHGAHAGSERRGTWGTTPVRVIVTVAQEDVNHLSNQLDVLLAPSIWPESFGLVVREALCAGLWVVASNLGGLPEPIVHGDNVLLIDVHSSCALSHALNIIENDPATYTQTPALTTALRTMQKQTSELVAVYHNLQAA